MKTLLRFLTLAAMCSISSLASAANFRTVVIDAHLGERENKQLPVVEKHGLRNVHLYEGEEWVDVREAVGDEPHLLHDAHHRLTPIEAARLARDLEPQRLYWLEDPVPAAHPGRGEALAGLAAGQRAGRLYPVRNPCVIG